MILLVFEKMEALRFMIFFKLNFLGFLCLFLKKISEFMGLLEFGLLVGEEHEVHVLGKEEHDVLTKKLTKSNKKN